MWQLAPVCPACRRKERELWVFALSFLSFSPLMWQMHFKKCKYSMSVRALKFAFVFAFIVNLHEIAKEFWRKYSSRTAGYWWHDYICRINYTLTLLYLYVCVNVVLTDVFWSVRFVCVCSVQTFSFYVVLVLLKMSKDHKNHHSYGKHCPIKIN